MLSYLFYMNVLCTIFDILHDLPLFLKVWKKMRKLKLQPDIYSYNLLIRCTAECKAGEPTFTTDLLLAPPTHESQHSIKNKRTPKKISNVKKVLLVEAKHELASDNYDGTCTGSVDESHSVSQVSKDNNCPDEKLYPEVEVEGKASGSEGNSVMLPSILGRTVTSGAVVALNSLDQPQDRLV